MTSGPPISREITGSFRMHHSFTGSARVSTFCRSSRSSTARSICLGCYRRRTEVITVRT